MFHAFRHQKCSLPFSAKVHASHSALYAGMPAPVFLQRKNYARQAFSAFAPENDTDNALQEFFYRTEDRNFQDNEDAARIST
jgi:hypothetical protein